MTDEVSRQHTYHEQLFSALYDWPSALSTISDHTSVDGLLGLDQMGHFGPHGCDRILEAVDERWRERPERLCELGSGFGGALRYVVDRLRRRGRGPVLAVGAEVVLEHCRLSAQIGESLGERSAVAVCASVTSLPLADQSLDVVFAAGSWSHFSNVPLVLSETARVLRPGGLLAFTEEVSLLHPGATLSARFREFHPPGVFFVDTPDARRRQLRESGFGQIELELVSAWATSLLRDKLRASRLLRGTMELVFTPARCERIAGTLESALAEYEAGTLCPALVTAVRS